MSKTWKIICAVSAAVVAGAAVFFVVKAVRDTVDDFNFDDLDLDDFEDFEEEEESLEFVDPETDASFDSVETE